MKKITKISIISALLLPISTNFAHADSIQTKQLESNIVSSSAQAKHLISKLPGTSAIEQYADQYKVKTIDKDNNGFTHYTLTPEVNGIEGLNREIKVHVNPHGKVVMVNGELNEDKVVATNTIKISKETAIDNAFKSVGLNPETATNIDGKSPVKSAELFINPDKKLNVYYIKLTVDQPTPAYWHIQVNAETGEVVSRQDRMTNANIDSRGIGYDGAYKPIILTKTTSGYAMRGTLGKETPIEIYDGMNSDRTQRVTVTDTDKVFKNARHRDAVDANYYLTKSFNYFKNVHNRESFSNLASTVKGVVHDQVDRPNASWSGSAFYFGDGDGGKNFTPFSNAYDIVAHEFTHAVTEYSADLQYESESGAMNEHMSDAFAYFMEPNWTFAEKIITPDIPNDALRYYEFPENSIPSQPNHMSKFVKMPVTAEGDWGGVHFNCGILNRGLFNLIETEKMDIKVAEKIYYRALTVYLTPRATFADFKKSLLQSARDLYNEEEAQKVERALTAIGL